MRNVSAGKCIVVGDNYSGCYVGGRGRGFIALQLWEEEGGECLQLPVFVILIVL